MAFFQVLQLKSSLVVLFFYPTSADEKTLKSVAFNS